MSFYDANKQNEFSKSAYEYCNNVSWNEEKMQEYAARMDTTYEVVRDQALMYVKDEIGENEYLTALMLINKHKSRNFSLNIDKYNPTLFLINGAKVYKLWRNNEERYLVLRYIYDTWVHDNYNVDQIVEQFGISRGRANSLVNEYLMDIKKVNPSHYRSYSIHPDKTKWRNVSYDVFYGLLNANDLEEMIDIIKSNGYDISRLKSDLHNFIVSNYSRDDYDKYYKILNDKISRCREYIKEENAKKNKEIDDKYINNVLPSANKMIELFIESNCKTIQEFIVEYKIGDKENLTAIQIFDECVKIVREYNNELYERYRNKIKNTQGQNYAILISYVKKVANLISNGIIENNIKRQFDLIDYFQNCNLSFEAFLKFSKQALNSKDITVLDYKNLLKFINNNIKYEKFRFSDIKVIMDEKQELNCEKDKDGFPISGTGEIVSEETKNKLINYLKSNKIPVNYKTYRALFNRYSNGFISLDEEKSY